LNEEVAFELLKVSDLYSLPALKNLCELFLAKSLTVVNAVKLTNLAQQYDAMKLKKNCLEFISIHKKNFHESDLVNLDKYSLIELFKLQP